MPNPVVDIHEYLELEALDRMILLQSSGAFIDSVKIGFIRNDLYMLGDFYIEVQSVRINCIEKIKSITPFIKGPRLEKYLENIDLDSLLQ